MMSSVAQTERESRADKKRRDGITTFVKGVFVSVYSRLSFLIPGLPGKRADIFQLADSLVHSKQWSLQVHLWIGKRAAFHVTGEILAHVEYVGG